MKAITTFISLLAITVLAGCFDQELNLGPKLTQKTLNSLSSNISQRMAQLILVGETADTKAFSSELLGKVPVVQEEHQVAAAALKWYGDSDTLLKLGVEWRLITSKQYDNHIKTLAIMSDYRWYTFPSNIAPLFLNKEQAEEMKMQENQREVILKRKKS